MKRIALYLRVSKSDGSQSTENQRPECEELARARGEIVHVYEEQGSAVKKRPAFEAMLKAAQRRRFDVLVIWSLDRFGRSTIGNLLDVRSLDAAGVAIMSCREAWLNTNGATDDPMARIQRNMLIGIVSSIAEMERVRLIERTRAGLATARRRGKRLGRPPAERRHKDQKGVRLDLDSAREAVNGGASIRATARVYRVSEATLRRALRRSAEGATETPSEPPAPAA